MSPRSIPLVLTSNFSASPSSRHDPAAMDVGANPPIAIGSTTPFSFSSTAIGRRTLNPEAPLLTKHDVIQIAHTVIKINSPLGRHPSSALASDVETQPPPGTHQRGARGALQT